MECPILNPFNIREKVEICEEKDTRKMRQMLAEKMLQKLPAKNPPKRKQFSRVMALTDLHRIRKLFSPPPGGLE